MSASSMCSAMSPSVNFSPSTVTSTLKVLPRLTVRPARASLRKESADTGGVGGADIDLATGLLPVLLLGRLKLIAIIAKPEAVVGHRLFAGSARHRQDDSASTAACSRTERFSGGQRERADIAAEGNGLDRT